MALRGLRVPRYPLRLKIKIVCFCIIVVLVLSFDGVEACVRSISAADVLSTPTRILMPCPIPKPKPSSKHSVMQPL